MTWSDDPVLLEAMLEDWENGGTKAEITGELVTLYDEFADQLRTHSLGDLRERRVRGLTAIGAIDDHPGQYPLLRLSTSDAPAAERRAIADALRFAEAEPGSRVLPYDLSLTDLEETAFRVADLHGRVAGAVPLADLEMSTGHDPHYTFLIRGKRYSYLYLYYYLHYAYCAQFLDFDQVGNVIEMGSGAGRVVEILKRAHPNLTFYLVDLAPTLYVCQRNLSGLFAESVVPYSETRGESRATAPRPGSIVFLQPHQIQAIAPEGPTLSFNAGVFDLMTPQTVQRYLSVLKSHADWVYLMEPRTDETKRLYGMPEAPTFDTYRSILEPEFHLTDRRDALKPLSVRRDFGMFETTFWARATNQR